MDFNGRYKFSFSKVPGKVMENEVTIQPDGTGKFTGFLHNASGDNPIQGTIDDQGRFAFAFAGGHRHAEQEGHPPAGGPGGPGHGKPGGPPAGEPLIMNFAGTIHQDGTLVGTLTVLSDVTAIQGKKL